MIERRLFRVLLLAALLWLAGAVPAMAAEEGDFCSSEAQIQCPRTAASICVCFMSSRTAPADSPAWIFAPWGADIPRVKRPAQKMRILPQPVPDGPFLQAPTSQLIRPPRMV